MKAAYLIGFRGAGKTTLGRALASAFAMEFLDLDEIWEKRSSRTIVDFVEKNGIEAFRKEEEGLLREVELSGKRAFVATGGGVVDWPASVRLLEQSKWPKIYLHVPSRELWERLQSNPERLKIGDLRSIEEMEALLARRRGVYEKIATFSVENRVITDSLKKLAILLKEP